MFETQVITLLQLLTVTLTPRERLDSLRPPSSDHVVDYGYYIMGLLAVLVLVVIFVLSGLVRKKKARNIELEAFQERAREKGLSQSESELLNVLAGIAGLKKSESVFTLSTAFDRGAGKVLEESIAKGRSLEDAEQLKMGLCLMREKLGFGVRPAASLGLAADLSKLNTRQIPKGKKLSIVPQGTNQLDKPAFEVTVEDNSPLALTVSWTEPVKLTFGQPVCVRGYYGATVWEFDTTVAGCMTGAMLLNHNGRIRLVNRRRFLRVPVRLPAYIRSYSFAIIPLNPGRDDLRHNEQLARSKTDDTLTTNHSEPQLSGQWGSPEFVPAVVTELSGPGLRIQSTFKVHMDDRILVIVGLPSDFAPNLQYDQPDSALPPSKMLEDVAVVRHVKPTSDGWSVAVELTGISDSNVDELIRITNDLAIKLHGGGADASVSQADHQKLVAVAGTTTSRGV